MPVCSTCMPYAPHAPKLKTAPSNISDSVAYARSYALGRCFCLGQHLLWVWVGYVCPLFAEESESGSDSVSLAPELSDEDSSKARCLWKIQQTVC